MKKRILTLLAAVCLLSAVLSGCGGGSQNGTTGTTDQSTANTQTEGPAEITAAKQSAAERSPLASPRTWTAVLTLTKP